MTDQHDDDIHPPGDDRRFAVSANRGQARHRVRYVESGGGTPDDGCRVCAPVVAPAGEEQSRMWNERYGRDEYLYGTAPNDFLAGQARRIPPDGRVLCLADGEGRNSVYLASLGHKVTAVDFSAVALRKAARLAEQHGVRVELEQADLSRYRLEPDHWDGILSIFCHLPPVARHHLHQQIPSALTGQGLLILEAYTPQQLGRGTGGPPDAELMMSAATLREELAELDFLLLEERERDVVEGHGHTGRGAVVQAVGVRRNIDLDQTGSRPAGPAR